MNKSSYKWGESVGMHTILQEWVSESNSIPVVLSKSSDSVDKWEQTVYTVIKDEPLLCLSCILNSAPVFIPCHSVPSSELDAGASESSSELDSPMDNIGDRDLWFSKSPKWFYMVKIRVYAYKSKSNFPSVACMNSDCAYTALACHKQATLDRISTECVRYSAPVFHGHLSKK